MKTKYFLIASLFLALASCSENKGKKSNSDNVDLESAIENAESRRKDKPRTLRAETNAYWTTKANMTSY